MTDKNYEKLMNRVKQIYSINYQPIFDINFELEEKFRGSPFPKAKKIEHQFQFMKYSPIKDTDIRGMVEITHKLVVDDETFITERYVYVEGAEDIVIEKIMYGGDLASTYMIPVKNVQLFHNFLLVNDNNKIDFDKFFKILDLKIIELV